MGILSDLTPAIFKLEGHEIRARVLPVEQVMDVIKDELVKSKHDLGGATLDQKATECFNKFDFSDAMAAQLIYQGAKDCTEGFDMADAQLLTTPVHGATVGYELFKYVVYGVFASDIPDDDGDQEKKDQPGQPAST